MYISPLFSLFILKIRVRLFLSMELVLYSHAFLQTSLRMQNYTNRLLRLKLFFQLSLFFCYSPGS